jgi:hypothetical protein
VASQKLGIFISLWNLQYAIAILSGRYIAPASFLAHLPQEAHAHFNKNNKNIQIGIAQATIEFKIGKRYSKIKKKESRESAAFDYGSGRGSRCGLPPPHPNETPALPIYTYL